MPIKQFFIHENNQKSMNLRTNEHVLRLN